MTAELYLGLDLTASPRKPTAYGVLDQGLELVGLGSWGADREIMEQIGQLRPGLIAIDAPLFLPLGLCCLEETCQCSQRFPQLGRVVERLFYGQGISSYPVTKKTFFKELVYRGMALGREMRRAGFQVLEVYPYASKVRLFGRPIPPKNTAAGRAFLRQTLTALVPSLAQVPHALRHDECDAIVAAYTAYLYRRGFTEAVGHPQEGFTHVPRQRFQVPGLARPAGVSKKIETFDKGGPGAYPEAQGR